MQTDYTDTSSALRENFRMLRENKIRMTTTFEEIHITGNDLKNAIIKTS